MTFRILIDLKSLCSWGVGREHVTIYGPAITLPPNKKHFVGRHLQQLLGHERCHFQQGQTGASILVCHSLTLYLGPSAMLSLPSASRQWHGVAKQHLLCPSVGCCFPLCGSSDFEDKGLLWRAKYLSLSLSLSPLFLPDEVKNQSFWIWQIKSCIWLLWGKSHWKWSLGDTFTARCQGLELHTQHTHPEYS